MIDIKNVVATSKWHNEYKRANSNCWYNQIEIFVSSSKYCRTVTIQRIKSKLPNKITEDYISEISQADLKKNEKKKKEPFDFVINWYLQHFYWLSVNVLLNSFHFHGEYSIFYKHTHSYIYKHSYIKIRT